LEKVVVLARLDYEPIPEPSLWVPQGNKEDHISVSSRLFLAPK
jgi:hypothetical protein